MGRRSRPRFERRIAIGLAEFDAIAVPNNTLSFDHCVMWLGPFWVIRNHFTDSHSQEIWSALRDRLTDSKTESVNAA